VDCGVRGGAGRVEVVDVGAQAIAIEGEQCVWWVDETVWSRCFRAGALMGVRWESDKSNKTA